MNIGYVRTAGFDAVPMEQVARLVRAGCAVVYVESSGGEHLHRPVLHRMVQGLQRGDVVLLVDLERLSRQASQMDILLRRIQERGAVIRMLEPDPAHPDDTL